MPKTGFHSLLHLIRRVLHDPGEGSCPDQLLLQRYLTDRSETAFEVILRRHGPMVLDVCRSMLPNEADVEDAFQATFLILAKKAKSIRRESSLAGWLHGVAYRVACKSQTEFARRQKHEALTAVPTGTIAADDLTWRELRQVIHEELDKVPRPCREALALCYLQGMNQDRAAEELDLPKGTLKGRLERGRAILRARLVRRGLGPTGLLVASAWPSAGISGELSAALVASTLRASTGLAAGQAIACLASARIIALVQGLLDVIFWKKIKMAGAVIALLGVVCLGSYSLAVHFSGNAPQPHGERGHAEKDTVQSIELPNDDLWSKSSDGIVALRVSARPVQAKAWEPITLTASLHNLSGQPIRVLRPFGRGSDSIQMKGLDIRGHTAKLRYDGPHDADAAFAFMAPGQTVEDRIVIRAAFEGFKLRGVDLPAVQSITFEYLYDANADADPVALVDVWKGRIRSKTISVEIEGERR
jgi:RNA polymerase sigma factor (sigma-70 family)